MQDILNHFTTVKWREKTNTRYYLEVIGFKLIIQVIIQVIIQADICYFNIVHNFRYYILLSIDVCAFTEKVLILFFIFNNILHTIVRNHPEIYIM